MSGSLRLVLILLAVVFGTVVVLKVASVIVGFVWSLVVPIAVVGVLVGAVYFAGRKALGGGRRTLP